LNSIQNLSQLFNVYRQINSLWVTPIGESPVLK
jgi:hypothetical protein